MVGMLAHLDASTHESIAGLPMQDLMEALDDADGRILYARFFPQKGTASIFAASSRIDASGTLVLKARRATCLNVKLSLKGS